MKIAVINGAKFEPARSSRTGSLWQTNFEDYFEELVEKYSNVEFVYFQSNVRVN
jgi:hypothetical protein